MSEKLDSLRRQPDGKLPLDAALDDLRTDPSTVFHLLPLPMATTRDKKSPTNIRKDGATKTAEPTHKGKGKGKGKNRGKNRGKMPVELVGLHQTMKSGKRICYNYDLARGCQSSDSDCSKGAHVCMKCFGAHPAHACTNSASP